jgi:hypothetical protein
MLQGYRDAFGDFENLTDLARLFRDPDETNLFPLYAYPAFVAACLKGVDSLGAQNPALVTRAADALQCLLAIMLYYCQPSLFARAVSRSSAADGVELAKFKSDLLAIAPADTKVSLAGLRYQIVVGRATLVAYVVLCAISLLLCLIVLMYGSFSRLGWRVPPTSPFPFLDSAVRCEEEFVDGTAQAGRKLDIDGIVDSNKGLLTELDKVVIRLNGSS